MLTYSIPFSSPVYQDYVPKNRVHSQSDKKHIQEAIDNLLSIGAISPCEPVANQFLSDIFLVPKPNGKYRFILNLKQLNKFISTVHFKLEDFRTAVKLVSEKCYMTTIDLKDAYFSVRIHDDSKKYLRFCWENNIYEFNVLPFGLNTAPFVFTKIMKPVLKLLRLAGFLSTGYLDDIFLIGKSRNECLHNIFYTQKLLTSLGFIINEEKSNMLPSTSCKFLGFIIDSDKFEIKLTQEKRLKIKNELNKFSKLNSCKIRDFARLVGLLTSACPAIEYGWLYTKNFERWKFLNLKEDDNYEKQMNIPKSLSSDFKWWIKSIDYSVNKIKKESYDLEIFTDASTSGWGAACGEETASGQWNEAELSYHINHLEILAAYFGLKVFAKNLHDCQILLRVDNTTAIAYINRMGGIQFPHLTQAARELWQWCERRNIFVFAAYIRSCDNTIADAESRRIHPDVEWELSEVAFNTIKKRFGNPEIDIFASRINAKCKRYISWQRDPNAYAINAFTVSWSNIHFYGFPPFAIILKTLRKIIQDKATGVIVVPLWPTQPWYPIFVSLLVGDPLIFEPSHNLIISRSSNRDVHKRCTLVAGLLSGSRY